MTPEDQGRSMKKILVVEDDPVNVLVLYDFLSTRGYQTTLARNGPDGLARFEQDEPDLAIIDVQLPLKNGFEVCFDIRRSPKGQSTAILLMSAVYTDIEHAERHATEGLQAQGYLLKPFELTTLLDHVYRLIGKP
jgi:CheY-like chemotaxis protein